MLAVHFAGTRRAAGGGNGKGQTVVLLKQPVADARFARAAGPRDADHQAVSI